MSCFYCALQCDGRALQCGRCMGVAVPKASLKYWTGLAWFQFGSAGAVYGVLLLSCSHVEMFLPLEIWSCSNLFLLFSIQVVLCSGVSDLCTLKLNPKEPKPFSATTLTEIR
ncbi:hypothetical protein U1Q18_013508 [Sarracenia purpurea var. burkii]